VEERVFLEPDRRTLKGQQAVASGNTCRIMVNNELYIPQGGLSTVAQLFSTASGPYDLTPDTDGLTIETSTEIINVSFGVTSPTRFRTDEVVSIIRRLGATSLHVENANGHLVLTETANVADKSFLKVSGTSVLALGYGDPTRLSNRQYAARGKRLYPSWQLKYADEDLQSIAVLSRTQEGLLEDVFGRVPVFDAPIRGNPVFKLTYGAPPDRCLRCRRMGAENDIRYDLGGEAILLENEDLLQQGALKILLTRRGSNPYHPFYGTRIQDRIGLKALSGITSIIGEDVRRGLANFQNMQRQQGQYQRVTARERLYRVLSVRSSDVDGDPTMVVVEVTVQNGSSEPVSLSSLFTTPDVIAFLRASNGTLSSPNAAQVGL